MKVYSGTQLIIQNCLEAFQTVEQGTLIVDNNMVSMSGSISVAASAFGNSFIQCIGGTTVGKQSSFIQR